MATPAWLPMTANGWVPALHLPDFSRDTVGMLASFLIDGEVLFAGKDDFQELRELFSLFNLLQVPNYNVGSTSRQCKNSKSCL
jgi:hypothetical protein